MKIRCDKAIFISSSVPWPSIMGCVVLPFLPFCVNTLQNISCYENFDSTCCWVKMPFFASCWNVLPMQKKNKNCNLWGWLWLLAFKEGIVCYSQWVKESLSNTKFCMLILQPFTILFCLVAGFPCQSQEDSTLYPEFDNTLWDTDSPKRRWGLSLNLIKIERKRSKFNPPDPIQICSQKGYGIKGIGKRCGQHHLFLFFKFKREIPCCRCQENSVRVYFIKGT